MLADALGPNRVTTNAGRLQLVTCPHHPYAAHMPCRRCVAVRRADVAAESDVAGGQGLDFAALMQSNRGVL